jgi:two-component system NtrC family sensor kinase
VDDAGRSARLSRASLRARLAGAAVLVTLAAVGPLVPWAQRLQRSQAEHAAATVALSLSDSIKGSTHDHMLADRRSEAYATMRAIGRAQGIERVRLFDSTGRTAFSTCQGEAGVVVDKRSESCASCHQQDRPLLRPLSERRTRIYHDAAGARVLGVITPLYNEPGCSNGGCHAHPADRRVLGVLDVSVSLREVDAGLRALNAGTLFAAGGGVLLLAVGMSVLTQRMLARPLFELTQGTQRIAEGDLAHRIPVRSLDEVGRLAASFNHMTDALAGARREIKALLDGLEREVEQRTAALRDAQGQLVQSAKLASLGRIAASIAHEINNPLTGILTFARLLLRTLPENVPDAAAREKCLANLRLVERETQRCSEIVRQLLDFARQRPLTLAPLDVNAPLREALALLRHQLELKGVALEQRLAPGLEIEGDFGQLRQAFVNVILNACDALATGGRLSVETRALPDAKRVEVVIEDGGAGIAREHLEHIFDPFFTTKEKGTGLGLSVVYGIVDRHGGRLEVTSEPGRGTRVAIRLPAAAREGA